MMISGTHVEIELNVNPDYRADAQLDQIIAGMNQQLHAMEKSGLSWLGLTKKRYHRYRQSWMRINIDLVFFLENPNYHYSLFMRTLDREYHKFPTHSQYAKQLAMLIHFMEAGPVFSDTLLNMTDA